MQKHIFIAQALASSASRTQAEAVLCKVLGCSREHLFLLTDISAEYLYEFQKYLYEFQKGVPDAYILGEQEFLGRKFFCNSSTLIPRRETELLVEVLKKLCLERADMSKSSYIDVGTGTSCILTSLLLELAPLRFSQVYGLDITRDILELSLKNTNSHGLTEVEFLQSSLLETLLEKKYPLETKLYISANLPYIKRGDEKNMGSDVLRFEPDSALYGGDISGFELYEQLLKECFYLKKGYQLESIDLVIEIGYDQYEHSQKILRELGLQFEYFQDMHTIARVIHIYGF